MEEIWENTKESDVYKVNDKGVVRSVDRIIEHKNGCMMPTYGRVIKPYLMPNGYLQLGIVINGKMRKRYVHRLVAQAFIPNPDNKPEVNHLDGDKTNNHVLNLKWCTRSENNQHAYDTGLRVAYVKRGKDHRCSKKVLDAKTGIYYESIKDAYNSSIKERSYDTFREHLNRNNNDRYKLA